MGSANIKGCGKGFSAYMEADCGRMSVAMRIEDPDLFRQQCYLAGEWVSGGEDAKVTVINPASGDVLGVVR